MADIVVLVKFGFSLIFVVFQQICMVGEHISALCGILENNCFMLGCSNTWEVSLLSDKSTRFNLYCSLQQRPNRNLWWGCATVTVVCVWCSEGCWHRRCAQSRARWWTQGERSPAPPSQGSPKDGQGNSWRWTRDTGAPPKAEGDQPWPPRSLHLMIFAPPSLFQRE